MQQGSPASLDESDVSSIESRSSSRALDPPRFTFGPVPSTQSFAASNGRPWLASVHAGESLLVLGTHAGSVYVLDPSTPDSPLLRALKPHSASVQAVATDPAERYVASVGLDGLVSISAIGAGGKGKGGLPNSTLPTTPTKKSGSGLPFNLPFVPSVSSSSADGPAEPAYESWTYSDGRPLRAIALDPLFHRRTTRAFVTGGNAGNVVLRELPASPSSASGVPGMGQFGLSWLRRAGQGEHAATVLHSSETDGPIWALTWRTHLLAWACDRGVRIYDIAARTKVAFIVPPGPEVQPALSPPHFAWRDKRHLVIGWDKTVKIVRIRPRQAKSVPRSPAGRARASSIASNITTAPSTSPSPPPSPGAESSDQPSRPVSGVSTPPLDSPRRGQRPSSTTPRLAADVIQILHLDAEVAGVVPCGLDLLVLAHVEEDGGAESHASASSASSPIGPHSHTSGSSAPESPLELRLISSSGEELNAEPVPLPPHPPGRRQGVTGDYALACPGGSCADLDVAAVTAALAQAEMIMAAAMPEERRHVHTSSDSPGAGEQDADDEEKSEPYAAPRSMEATSNGGSHGSAVGLGLTPPTGGSNVSTPAPPDLPAGTDATFYILTPFGLTASHPATWQDRVDYLLSLNAYEAVLGQLEALGRKYADALGYGWAEIGMMYLYQLVRSGTSLPGEEDDAPVARHRRPIADGPERAAAQAPTTLARDEDTWEAFVFGLAERAGKWALRHHGSSIGSVPASVRALVAEGGEYLSCRSSDTKEVNPYIVTLTALVAHLPTNDPQLCQPVYNLLFAHLIIFAPAVLREVADSWPPTLYDVERVVEALEEQRGLILAAQHSAGRRAETRPTEWDHLTFTLARVFMRTGRPGTALPLLLSVRWPGVFRLIAEHGLFSAVQDLAGELVLFDRDVHRPPPPLGTVGGTFSLDNGAESSSGEPCEFGASIALLVRHALSITPARVVPQLQGLGQKFEQGQAAVSADDDVASAERDGLYLYIYLSSLLRAVSAAPAVVGEDESAAVLSPTLIAPYADQLVQLAARFDRETLMIVLRSLAEEYDIQKAYQVCLARDFVPEMVLLLGRVGDTKRALDLILTRLGDVRRALTFVQEHHDPELWEDLFKYSETRPAFITAILTYGGDSLDAARFITRLADGLVIPGLRDALIRLLTAKRRQLDLLSGCADVLAMETGTQVAERQRTISAALASPFTVKRTCSVCAKPLFPTPSTNPATAYAAHTAGKPNDGVPKPVSGEETDPAIVFLCQHVCHLQCCIGGPPRLKARLPSMLAHGTKGASLPSDLERIERYPFASSELREHVAAEPFLRATIADMVKPDEAPHPHPPWGELVFPPGPAVISFSGADRRHALRLHDAARHHALRTTLSQLDAPLRPACPLCRVRATAT